MEINEILTQSLDEFYDLNNGNKNKMEDVIVSYGDFFEFVEKNPDIKDTMYSFFYKLFNDYVLFRFYNDPIPALITSKEYMEERKKQILQTAATFFNFGGITGVKQ